MLGVGALVISCFSTIMVLLWGMLGSVSVLVARYHGANEPVKMASVLKAAIWATVILSIPFGLIIWKLTTILGWLGQSPELLKLAVPYAHALRWAVLPDLLNMVLMQFLIGLGRSRLALVLSLSWFQYCVECGVGVWISGAACIRDGRVGLWNSDQF
jgi:MATE family multidrug resistance protein